MAQISQMLSEYMAQSELEVLGLTTLVQTTYQKTHKGIVRRTVLHTSHKIPYSAALKQSSSSVLKDFRNDSIKNL